MTQTFSTKDPIKRNMEEGGFSLMRKIFNNSATSTKRNNTGSTQNLSFQDTSSNIEKRKALAIGKKNLAQTISYNSYDPNEVTHVKRRIRGAGCVAPKKKGYV